MPKYTSDVVAGYILYFTSKCVVEAMHVHASDKEMSQNDSAKLFVLKDGSTKVERTGCVNEKDMKRIQRYIKNNYIEMYKKWKRYSDTDFYNN